MSGILDSKQRIMDTIVTLEGRRQIADGKLKIEYVSFTDGTAFYSPDMVSGSSDATNRLYFEQCHLPQDQITFEADDSGKLKPFKNAQNIDVFGGKILTPTTVKFDQVLGSTVTRQYDIVVGGEFVSSGSTLLSSSIENFRNLYLIGTNDNLFLEDENFEVNPKFQDFLINNYGPIQPAEYVKSINNMPSLFADKHFSNVINFKYLPPVNRIDDKNIDKSIVENTTTYQIGNYARLGLYDEYTIFDLEKDLVKSEESGYKKTFKFEPTSFKNMLVSQIFELSNGDLTKLDVLEYGAYKYDGVEKQVYFAGKMLVDDYGTNTFIKLFTLVFE